jgi:hypothetical protein
MGFTNRNLQQCPHAEVLYVPMWHFPSRRVMVLLMMSFVKEPRSPGLMATDTLLKGLYTYV